MAKIEAQQFLRATKCALAAVKKSPLPIFEHLLFRFGDGKLKITGANAEFQITANCDADPAETQSFCVPADRVRRIAASSGEIDIRVSENRVIFKTNLGRYQIATLPAEDYPALESVTGVSFILSGDLIGNVLHACADRDVRYYLNGVHIFAAGKVCVEASDGHRAARNYAEDVTVDAFDAIVPREAAKIVASLGNVGATFGSRSAAFATDDMVLTTKLTEGKFPDLGRVFPQYQSRFAFGRDAALTALRAISGCADERGAVAVQAANGVFRLTARNHNDEAESEFPIQGADGITLGLNANYLLDAVSAQPDSMEMAWLDDQSSVVLHSARLTEVIMPLRL